MPRVRAAPTSPLRQSWKRWPQCCFASRAVANYDPASVALGARASSPGADRETVSRTMSRTPQIWPLVTALDRTERPGTAATSPPRSASQAEVRVFEARRSLSGKPRTGFPRRSGWCPADSTDAPRSTKTSSAVALGAHRCSMPTRCAPSDRQTGRPRSLRRPSGAEVAPGLLLVEKRIRAGATPASPPTSRSRWFFSDR
jgi:hypothetical protein